MRKKRDAEGTKSKILQSAEKIFAENGFSGTSIAMISKASGISDGLILYHFKTKDNLYKQVVERISAHYSEIVRNPLDKDFSIEKAMYESLTAAFDFWKKDKTSQRISLWAYLENREDNFLNEAQMIVSLTAYLTSLQESGHFPKDIHPVVFLTMIIGTIQFWFRHKKRFVKILHLKEEKFDDRFFNQFSQMLKRSLATT